MAINQIVNRGLVVAYDLGNTLSYPGMGTLITDLNKSGINLLTVNGAGWTSSNWGSLITGGSGGGVQNAFVKSAALNPGTNSVSWGVMFKYTDTHSTTTSCFSYYAGGRADTDAISCYMTVGGNIFFYIRDGAANTVTFTTTGAYNDGKWHYATMSYNASTKTINCYVDGAFVGTTTNSSFTTFAFIAIDFFGMGGDGTNTGQYFQGNIACLHYYFSSLTAQEILINYQYLLKRIIQ